MLYNEKKVTMGKDIYLSAEGLEKLKAELEKIEDTEMKEIAKRIAEAKDLGDLSENAEYHEAKRLQSFMHGRASDLKYKIKNAMIIEKGQSCDTVTVGCTVEVVAAGEKMSFEIVGSEEADPMNGKISSDSPIGSSLLGKKLGESVKVATPSGESEYQIQSIK